MRSNWKMRLGNRGRGGSDFHIFHSLGSRNPSPTNEEQVISCIELERERETCICLESRQKTNKLTTTRTKTWLSKSTEKNFFFLLNWRLWLISSDRPWFQLDKAICRRKKFQPLVKKLGGELEKGLLSFSDTTTTFITTAVQFSFQTNVLKTRDHSKALLPCLSNYREILANVTHSHPWR